MAKTALTLEAVIKKRNDQLSNARINSSKCGQSVSIMLDKENHKYIGKTCMCHEDICPVCGPRIKQKEIQELVFVVNKYGLYNMYTVTADCLTFDLIDKNHEALKKHMIKLESPEAFQRRTKCKDAKRGFRNFIVPCVREEKFFVWLFNCKYYDVYGNEYSNRFHHAKEVQKHLKMDNLPKWMQDKYGYKGDLTKYEKLYHEKGYDAYEMYIDMIGSVANAFWVDIARDLLRIICAYECRTRKAVGRYCNRIAKQRIRFAIGKKFQYVKAWEFQHNDLLPRPHYHYLINTYIPYLIIQRLETDKCYIFDQGLYAKQSYANPDYEPELVASNSVRYITKYVIKDAKQHVFENDKLNRNGIISVPQSLTYSADITSFMAKYAKPETKGKLSQAMYTTNGSLPHDDYLNLGDDFKDSIKKLNALVVPAVNQNPNKYYQRLLEIEDQRKDELNAKKHDNAHKSKIHAKYDAMIISVSEDFLESEFKRREGYWRNVEHRPLIYGDLDEGQIPALDAVYNNGGRPVFVTGGAGTGKTKLIGSIIYNSNCHSALTSYTGKATDRARTKVAETLAGDCRDYTVKTIHSVCRAVFSHLPNFRAHEGRLLDYDMVIVDEAGMADCLTLAMCLNALPLSTRLVFVGDVNQLPPVQYSSCIKILNKYCDVHRLTTNHRSGEYVNQLAYSFFEDYVKDRFDDFDSNYDAIIDMVSSGWKCLVTSRRLEEKINLAMTKDFPILNDGTNNSYHYKIGQEVLFLVNTNNYSNGSTGIIKAYDDVTGIFTFICNDKEFELSTTDSASQWMPNYAMTVHKSQGSEYPNVIFVLDDYEQLSNTNIAYTAVSRAQRDIKLYKTKNANIQLCYNNLIE